MPLPSIVNRDIKTGRLLKEDDTFINFADLFVGLLDPSGGVAVNDELQNAIHSGNAYGLDADGTIAATSSLYFLGITGAKQIHFDVISADFQKGGVRLWLYEAPTVTANGTAQTTANLNFASANVSTMSVFLSPTITANGTKKSSKFFPLTGVGVNVAPRSGDIAGGRILKPNTKYLFRLENTDSSTCSFGANFVWHDSDVLL